MAITYEPNKILKKIANKNKINKLVGKNLNLNRAAVSTLEDVGVLPKSQINEVALKVLKTYKQKFKVERALGATKSEAIAAATNENALLIQRVQDTAIHEIAQTIKEGYRGEYYEWLPSDANEPDPEHQLKYGRKYQIGRGEMPGERWGCRCGMRILVDEDKLDL